ncbi:MAG: ankyrin repeat domain-containing protein [Pirellulaceae bacterium]
MRFDKNRQWVGAIYAEDLSLIREMLAEDPSLADSAHAEFDDPYRSDRYLVPTLLFAVAGPPPQQINWRHIERPPAYDLVQLLLELGANPNIDSGHGLPICYVRDMRVAQCLISHGADINRRTNGGGSAFFFSVWNCDPERLMLQLDLGVDVTQCDPRTHESALHIACLQSPETPAQETDLLEVATILLKHGADRHGRTNTDVETHGIEGCPLLFGETPLHLAAAFGVHSLVELLLRHGCDKSLTNAHGEIPRDVAARHQRPEETIKLLT